jgi:hypothetical protein
MIENEMRILEIQKQNDEKMKLQKEKEAHRK